MSDVMCTQNSRTAPVGALSMSGRGAVLLLVGALAGFAVGSDGSYSPRTDSSATAVPSEDWHGNVRRSHWTP